MKARFVMRLERDAGYINYEVRGRDLPPPYIGFSIEGWAPCPVSLMKKQIRSIISAPMKLPRRIRDVVKSLYGHLIDMHKELRSTSYSIGTLLELNDESDLIFRITLTLDDVCNDDECQPLRWIAKMEGVYRGYMEYHKLKKYVEVGNGYSGEPAEVKAELLRRIMLESAKQIYNAYAHQCDKT